MLLHSFSWHSHLQSPTRQQFGREGEKKETVPTAIGGEMEGGELSKFIGKGNIKDIIKGVAVYVDGEKIDIGLFLNYNSYSYYIKL